MSDNRKNNFAKVCFEERGTRLGQNLVEFLSFLQDEIRRRNDEAKIVEIYRNQGGVRILKYLSDCFIKNIQNFEKKT